MIVGWDIGGVYTKAARVRPGAIPAVLSYPLAIQHDFDRLPQLLRAMHTELGGTEGDRHVVTMTAELSPRWLTKREGVRAVLDAVEHAFPGASLLVYTVDGRFVTPTEARRQPLAVAASNWSAAARLVGRSHPDVLWIDTGSATTDIIPLIGGKVAARGRTDPERLATGELVYTGVVRTPIEAVLTTVPWRGSSPRVADGFALMGDAYLWLGRLEPANYACPTPDGRPADRAYAGERLARVICADRETMTDREIDAIARAAAAAQRDLIAGAIRQVRGRHPEVGTAVVSGLGAGVAGSAAAAASLKVVTLADTWGAEATRLAPAVAVALLADDTGRAAPPEPPQPSPPRPGTAGLCVIKVGGGLLGGTGNLERVSRAIARAGAVRPLVVIPGGGPFAERVREIDRALGLSAGAAHWMAILGMDQYAFALADKIPGGKVVTDRGQAAAVLAQGGIAVLAPARWLQAADELPHSWDVTSDSLAAYLAGLLGAAELVLVKPVAHGEQLVDPYFSRALAADLRWSVVGVDEIDSLEDRLRTS
jgi:probable H4MPT-linked C1 transfer pathway protein